MANKPKVVVVPGQALCRDILSESAKAKLESIAEPIWNEGEEPLTADQLKERLPGAWGCISSWGTPKFTEDLLSAADQLKIVGHAAGSVKGIFYPAAFDHGIVVVNAAATIADSVAEFTLTTVLALLRNFSVYDAALKNGEWPQRVDIHELYHAKVGIVSASMVGRRTIRLLEPFHCQIKVYDPYLPASEAAKLGVELVSLELVMRCPIILIHAPVTQETIGMIKAEHLKLIPDGAVLTNNARAVVMDYDALLAELQTGRFRAALDVFPKEPLPADSPFRKLDNVILSPHMAGWTTESRLRLIETVVDDFIRYKNGEPLLNQVAASKIAILA